MQALVSSVRRSPFLLQIWRKRILGCLRTCIVDAISTAIAWAVAAAGVGCGAVRVGVAVTVDVGGRCGSGAAKAVGVGATGVRRQFIGRPPTARNSLAAVVEARTCFEGHHEMAFGRFQSPIMLRDPALL